MRSKHILFSFLTLLSFVLVGLGSSSVRAEFRVVGESGSTLEVAWDGAEAASAGFGNGLETEGRFPSVNRPTTWIAVPPGGGIADIQIRDARWEPRPDLTLPPDPRLPDAWQGPVVSAGQPTYVRQQFGVPLGVTPWRLTTGGQIEALVSVRATVVIEGGIDAEADARSRARAESGRDGYESLYEAAFLNYESGKGWRRVPAEAQPALAGDGDYFSSTSAPWVRMTTQVEGLYAVAGTDLERIGIDLSDISDPSSIRVFTGTQLVIPDDAFLADAPGWMEEIAVMTEGLEDGVFDPSDRLIFLGHGPDDWFSNKGVDRPGLEDFYRDPSANESTYWMTWGGTFQGEPVRMAVVDGSGAQAPFVRSVRDRVHHEGNEFFDARQRENPAPDSADWEMFWWRELVTTEVRDEFQNVTVSIPDPVATEPVEVFARFWGANDPDSDEVPAPPDHDLELVLNGETLGRYQWDERRRQDVESMGTQLVPGDQQVFQLIGRAHPDATISRLDIVYLAFIEMTYTRELRARDGRLATFLGGVVGPQSFEVAEFSDPGDVRVVDATDPRRPSLIEGSAVGSTLQFRFDVSRDEPARLVASQNDAMRSPELTLESEPVGGYLRERTDAVQMIILTHGDFIDEAEDLAEYRRSNFPDRATASVAVVDVQQVYDEFAFGRKDPNAIRNFFELARDQWTGGNPEDGPAYALLMGDAHRDHRGLVVEDSPDFVPTYIRYFDNIFVRTIYDPRFSSDDYLVLLDGPGEVGMDMFLGRLVARTPAEARTMVEKTIRYEQQSDFGPWRNRITLVADDVCQGTISDDLGFLHMRQTEQLEEYFPASMDLKKNYLYEYGPECIFTNKPASAADLLGSMNAGTLVVNYTGHGGETQVSDERIFDVSSVASLDNPDRMFLFLTASCSIGKYDSSGEGLAEALIRYENGGSPVVFSASAVAFAQGNADMNKLFFDRCFPDGLSSNSRPMGEAAAVGKLLLNNTGLNQRRYAMHGDPAIALVAPGHEMDVELKTLDGDPLGGVLPRGTPVQVSGRIFGADGEVAEDFDGEAWVELFDSEIVREPTANDTRNDYQLPGATIYRGRATVQGGRFDASLFTPAALRTGDRGAARLYVYADDGTRDAAGSLPSLTVPETTPPPSDDVDGPELQLGFVSGGTTVSPEAVFTASLQDASGINVTGLVPSRSVVFRLEQDGQTIFAEDISNSVVFGNDFREATLEHPLPSNLPEGRYELVLEASDNVNNRSGVRLNFALSGSGEFGLGLSQVFNLPNPMERSTRFYASIGEASEVEIQIFTLRGRKIRTLEGGFLTPNQLADEGIPWDGRDEDGDGLANGVYFYKLEATSAGGASQSTIGRLVVSR